MTSVQEKAGGEGAVREICDFIMKAQNILEPALNNFFELTTITTN
jgi:3-deoxy-D-manno-octulosonate 8-phosphate phosphatase KdsC-like HAD superfamily phosphatase